MRYSIVAQPVGMVHILAAGQPSEHRWAPLRATADRVAVVRKGYIRRRQARAHHDIIFRQEMTGDAL
jgi:hypothetical protein